MLKLLLINTLCFLSFTLHAYSQNENETSFLWDNHTYDTDEDLLADPLLAHYTTEHYTEPHHHLVNAASTPYERNPYVSEEVWNTVSPHFLPEYFPEKAALDRIFSKRRVLSSVKSMYKSGFNLITKNINKIIVARHPDLKGYIIKAFVDESIAHDWMCFMQRIKGVEAIRAKIVEKGYQGILKAPQKWIYPLPPEPSPLKEYPNRKNFILIVEEMDLLDKKHNLKAYKNKMTPQILDAFYVMLTELNLIDSVYEDNTGFCKDGRLAFVDTEHSLNTMIPVPLPTVAQYLSPQMVEHWLQLFFNGVQ